MYKDIAKYIDHTMLSPDAGESDLKKLCSEAARYGFAAVCIHPVYVSAASKLLCSCETAVCSVIGFPFGAGTTAVKLYEAQRALSDGACEIDMVMAISHFKNGNYIEVEKDISSIVGAARIKNVPVKVIIETSLLNKREKEEAAKIVISAGGAYVKTSTGFASGGAAVDDVKLLTGLVKGSGVKVKASGGIRTFSEAAAMISAGADRIGTSSGVAIVKESLAEK